jgi:methyl-accepting chemotaxis protein
MNLSSQLCLLVSCILVGVLLANGVLFLKGYREHALEGLTAKAASFTATADEAKNHASRLHAMGAMDKAALLADLEQIKKQGRDIQESKIIQTAPVVVGWTAARNAAAKEKLEFFIPAFNARNKQNSVEAASFRGQMLTEVTRQAEAEQGETLARIDPSENKLHFMRAIRLTEDCAQCHGTPDRTKNADGKDLVGFPMEGWKTGQVHGAYEVVMPLAPVDAQVRWFVWEGVLASAVLLMAGLGLFMWFMRRRFSQPLQGMLKRIECIAAGDLTERVDVHGEDELGRLGQGFNVMVDELRTIISDVRGAANEVASAATEVASSSEQMASNLDDQQQHVSHITASIGQMADSVTDVARHSLEAVAQARAAGDRAEVGGDQVRTTINGMAKIHDTVESSAQSVSALGQRSQQIGEIIAMINEIAEQTNLLALNAAIEAARAGEHGRGFAVVADEVRKLADRTTAATGQVSTAITAIQHETGEAVTRMHHGTEEVRAGVEQSRIAGESLGEIVNSARQVAQMIESIAAATEEQSATGTEIQGNLEHITRSVSESTEGANQAAQAAAQLSLKSEELHRLISRFKI